MKDEDSVKSRLLRVLHEKRMSQAEFARNIGVSPTYVGAMRKSVSKEKLRGITDLFPDLNPDWLLYGIGEMWISDEEPATTPVEEGYVVPLLPVNAYAGSLQMWSEGVALRDCEKVVSPVPGADFAIRISGDSMEPKFHNGTILFIKRINDKAFIPWGNPMVLDTENGVLVKAVYPLDREEDDDEVYIEARSYNPAYPPIKIPGSSIYSIFRILTSVIQYSTI